MKLAVALVLLSAVGVASLGTPRCFMGEPCGDLGCTSVVGSCKHGQCVEMFGKKEPCQPFANACGQGTYCDENEVCVEDGVCGPPTCENLRRAECPGDESALVEVDCDKFERRGRRSQYTLCMESDLFVCRKNESQQATECNAPEGGKAVAEVTNDNGWDVDVQTESESGSSSTSTATASGTKSAPRKSLTPDA